jgi:hypothetical protein
MRSTSDILHTLVASALTAIGSGFINSLSRPGGNFGLTTFERSIAGKWFSMLRVCPGTSSRITKFSEHEAD